MKNLIFDFDGVLGDTYEAVIQGLIESGREPDREAAIQNIINYSNSKSFHSKDHSMTPQEMQDYYDWVVRFGEIVHKHGFELFNEFVSTVENLHDTRIAVVSSGSQIYVVPALEQTNLHPTHILAFEDHHSKEEKVEHVCRDWDIPVSEAYYFTDTLADAYELEAIIAPEKLIGVTWGYCTREQLAEELPQANLLDEPNDIVKLF